MKTQSTKNLTVIILLTVLALVLIGLLIQTNRSGNKKLDSEKTRSEALLSDKLDLEQRMEAAQNDITGLRGSNQNLEKKLGELNEQLALKEKEIRRLMTDRNTVKELRQKNAELEALCSRMESDIKTLEELRAKLMLENGLLDKQLADLGSKNDSLVAQNAILEAMLADNFQIEAQKGKNEKLTLVARRANTLVSSFDVPEGMGAKLYFKVVTPDQAVISSTDSPYASIRKLNYESKEDSSGSFGARAELVYKPETKLNRGVYRFHVYDGDKYMGSVQLRLK